SAIASWQFWRSSRMVIRQSSPYRFLARDGRMLLRLMLIALASILVVSGAMLHSFIGLGQQVRDQLGQGAGQLRQLRAGQVQAGREQGLRVETAGEEGLETVGGLHQLPDDPVGAIEEERARDRNGPQINALDPRWHLDSAALVQPGAERFEHLQLAS